MSADLERRLIAACDELAAARATIASLRRQLALRVEAVSFTAVCVAFDEPTRRRAPATVSREPRVIDASCVETGAVR